MSELEIPLFPFEDPHFWLWSETGYAQAWLETMKSFPPQNIMRDPWALTLWAVSVALFSPAQN